MEFNKCVRCGCFYVSEGDVCPKCSSKDDFEYSTFKSYIEKIVNKGYRVAICEQL